MLLKLLRAERIKLKRSPVWIAFLIMPVIPAILGTLNYMGNLELLKSEWYSLWTQHSLFTCYFFLPIMLGIYCAYIMRLENSNHNWNKVLTMPVKRSSVFLAKLISASFMILISEIWIGTLFVISGTVVGLTVPPYADIITWCLLGTLGGIVMVSIQLILSIYIKSFALPIAIAFGGGLSGLLFLAKNLGHIWPYSLMAYGMNSNAPQKIIESGYSTFIIICIIYIAVFTTIGSVMISKRDI